MRTFVPGQRWISHAEPQMGLGTILALEGRTVTVHFLATGETRTYAQASAPLTRVQFGIGDRVRSHEGWEMQVDQVLETEGLLTYQGQHQGATQMLPEAELDNFLQLNRPSDRLFNRHIDMPAWFELRRATLAQRHRHLSHPLYGLMGGRTALIPHQLYIAHEVARRFAPRVLLADEVGLGKTIEAGLILHRQLLTEQAQRILIVVPESLTHQWLVEMWRRFHLRFSLFDASRCEASSGDAGHDNPFETAQWVLCSLEFLVQNPQRQQQALEAGWDLLVVDEAHHLHWTPDAASPEYRCIESLAETIAGVLLLTATPEQLGKAGHFARLRLLDPDRFSTYAHYLAEESDYAPLAQWVQRLLDPRPLSGAERTELAQWVQDRHLRQQLPDSDAPEGEPDEALRQALIDHLLDCHGTGRVLYRNTRHAIQGFPQRHLHTHPLPLPSAYREALRDHLDKALRDPQPLLCPERLYEQQAAPGAWVGLDPRVEWLREQLRALRPHKVLVICAHAETALDLAQHLRVRDGLHAAVFHEGMSLVERDRAAAFFADTVDGSQVLICSEIGSEGRNFQFAHHLIQFDLPFNPDLLEQRIGRLDRIGQTETVHIHCPYLEGSPQEVMLQWYHQGLNALEQSCAAAPGVFAQTRDLLLESLHQFDDGLTDLDELIRTTQQLHGQLNAQLQAGRDRLLEFHSCHPIAAPTLQQQAQRADQDDDLPAYLEQLLDRYGIDSEPHDADSLIMRPGEARNHHFPHLPDEGLTVTWSRDYALSHEEVQFLSWEHPLVRDAMEMILSSETGNCSMVAAPLPGVPAGSLLLEALYCLEVGARAELQTQRYLPPSVIRVVMDSHGRDRHAEIDPERLAESAQPIPKAALGKVIGAYEGELREMLAQAEQAAQAQAPALLRSAHQSAHQTLRGEVDRLQALARINPNVRQEEIAFFQQQLAAVDQALSHAQTRLDALRVIITT